MDRINEIGDTPKGQYALGQVYARANKRRSGIADAWTKQMPKKEYYTAAEYYPKGTKKYDDIMYDAKSEAECPPNRKVNMKSVVYNDKGYETTNFGLGIMDYEKSHKTNENKQYTNMNKKLIRLTESDLHRIVKESVNRIVEETNDDYNYNGCGVFIVIKRALSNIMKSFPKDCYEYKWATRVAKELNSIIENQGHEEPSDEFDGQYTSPYRKMGRMDTAI